MSDEPKRPPLAPTRPFKIVADQSVVARSSTSLVNLTEFRVYRDGVRIIAARDGLSAALPGSRRYSAQLRLER